MSSRRTLILIGAIAVGVFAGIALLNYVRGIEDDIAAEKQSVDVLVASQDIPEGTTAAEALQMIEVAQVPLELRPANFIPVDGTEQIAGLVARSDISANQIILTGLFVDPTIVEVGFDQQIPSGQVAITMQIDQVRAVGGYLQPGDEVNMMIVHESLGCAAGAADETTPTGEGDPGVGADALDVEGLPLQTLGDEQYCTYASPARYLFQRIEILAIGARQQAAPGSTTNQVITPQNGAITFMVPNEAAQLLASVDPADVYLTLVPEDYQAEQRPALTFDLLEGPTPAEIASCLTPYGPDGYIEGDAVGTETVAEDGSEQPIEHFSCATLWEQ